MAADDATRGLGWQDWGGGWLVEERAFMAVLATHLIAERYVFHALPVEG
jgi:hypothetical protein